MTGHSGNAAPRFMVRIIKNGSIAKASRFPIVFLLGSGLIITKVPSICSAVLSPWMKASGGCSTCWMTKSDWITPWSFLWRITADFSANSGAATNVWRMKNPFAFVLPCAIPKSSSPAAALTAWLPTLISARRFLNWLAQSRRKPCRANHLCR